MKEGCYLFVLLNVFSLLISLSVPVKPPEQQQFHHWEINRHLRFIPLSFVVSRLEYSRPPFVPACRGGASPGATTAPNHHNTSRNLPVTKAKRRRSIPCFFFTRVATHPRLSSTASRGLPLPRGNRPNLPSNRAHASLGSAAPFSHPRCIAAKKT